ncbi:hypothetical protein INS49_003751 [Diaporthe citri]|uniref:uncharacterized protein n=1 Tax=Diaporthe citri TaxID=83186 RepID=UPI001C7E2378|nr:uncharacterized protein INS49_003751 [Diaporthe citri]KAG6355785.1 hypothetical protein INS49_003751 [Diaporthe citri]
MANALKQKMSFRFVPNKNEALTAEIRNFVQTRQNADLSQESGKDPNEELRGPLEALLQQLYMHIRDFGSYLGSASTPDKRIFAAWESFLGPINALLEIEPHGHLIAARMTLYLAEAYRQHGQLPTRLPMLESSAKPIGLRCNFAISLDDLLLSCLAQIWTQSDKREMFKWAFTDYPVNACSCDIAGGSTCQDFAGPGNSVKEYHEQRKRDQVKTACITDSAALTPENGVQPRWRWKRAEGDTAQYPRHRDSSRAGYQKLADGESMLMWQDIGSDGPIRESFRYTLVDQDTGKEVSRHRAVLRRSRQFVLDARKIAECHLARDSERLAQMAMARRSLPAELQLMVFEYLDEIQEHPYVGKLDLSAVYLENHLNSIVRSRCGQGLTIGDIGLGPLDPAQLPTWAEDSARGRRLFKNYIDDDENGDDRDEARWSGISGLAGVMMHSKALLGLYNQKSPEHVQHL